MARIIEDKSLRIAIADENPTFRQLAADCLRGFGYRNISTFSLPKEILPLVQNGGVDWLVTSLALEDSITAFHLMKTVSARKNLSHVRTSLVLEASEEYCVPSAFEWGALSFHRRVLFHDAFKDYVGKFFEVLKSYQWDSCLTAAHYLRTYLTQKRNFQDLLKLEEKLINLYPGSVAALARLADACLLNGNTDRGTNILRQASLLDNNATSMIESLYVKHGVSRKPPGTEQDEPKTNLFGIKTAVVVEPDSAALQFVHKLLIQAGVPEIHCFSNGKTAWDWLDKNPEPGLIVHEWRITEVAGPVFVQRIRKKGYVNVPIVVLSSLVKKDEAPLLREMGVSEVLAKPFEQQGFFRTVVWALQQNRMPTEQRSLERKIKTLIDQNNYMEAERLIKQLNLVSGVSKAMMLQLEASIQEKKGNFPRAKELAIEALKMSGDSLFLLNLIGKILLELQDFPAALRFFEKAHKLSPANIDHLCHVAHLQIETGASAEAKESIEKIKQLDPQSLQAQHFEISVEMDCGKIERAAKLMEQIDDWPRYISYMNNRAVALGRTGRYLEATQLYERAMAALPKQQSGRIRAALGYNLGLTLARFGEVGKALDHLKKVDRTQASTEVAEKISQLMSRSEKFLSGGKTLRFQSDQSDDKPVEKTPEVIPEISEGELCCFMVFRPSVPQPEMQGLMARLEMFRPFESNN